ncbi:hypothetical protein Ae168Ps1_6225c [Pseudonocardia sp. Ae168_Ps1]|nr:hypothetical protein Ae168Ps1_6225c [Pseudonocardia sp. Ae168_Ps1]OLL71598.1 hypothetical protein Ae263Ps1_6086c [Pseudonocardia sp. Ae263_Ps1]
MGARTRRRPEGRAARHALAQLTEARDAVDAQLEDRRRRENTLLERYAATLVEQQRVEEELTSGLARIQEEEARLRAPHRSAARRDRGRTRRRPVGPECRGAKR